MSNCADDRRIGRVVFVFVSFEVTDSHAMQACACCNVVELGFDCNPLSIPSFVTMDRRLSVSDLDDQDESVRIAVRALGDMRRNSRSEGKISIFIYR